MTDEELLRQFMSEEKKTIPDKGFSHRVMRSLPLRQNRFLHFWRTLLVVLGVTIFLACDGIITVVEFLRNVFVYIVQKGTFIFDWRYVVAFLCLFAIVGFRKIWQETE